MIEAMKGDSWSSFFSKKRWADWWQGSKAPQPPAVPASARPDQLTTQRIALNLTAVCREITLLGSDSWPAVVQDQTTARIRLLMVQPFPPGLFLGVHIQKAEGGGPKYLVRIDDLSRHLQNHTWVLDCAIIRELPAAPEADAAAKEAERLKG